MKTYFTGNQWQTNMSHYKMSSLARIGYQEETPESVKIDILNKFMKELKLSGYTKNDRYNIIFPAINTYKKLKNEELLEVRL